MLPKAFLCKMDPMATKILNLKQPVNQQLAHSDPVGKGQESNQKRVIESLICAGPCAKCLRESKKFKIQGG